MWDVRGSVLALAAAAGCAVAIAWGCGTLEPLSDAAADAGAAEAGGGGDAAGAGSDAAGDAGAADACDTPLPERSPRYVFVTSATYHPGKDFKSVADGDALCAKVAADAGPKLAGRCFVAWLSDSTTSPAQRFVKGTGSYVRTDNETLATSWSNLTTAGPHAQNFDVNEKGDTIPSAGGDVWTGTEASGIYSTAKEDCKGWTSTSALGGTGSSNSKDNGWSAGTAAGCGADNRIYCFEK